MGDEGPGGGGNEDKGHLPSPFMTLGPPPTTTTTPRDAKCFITLLPLPAPAASPYPSYFLCKCGRICKHNHATFRTERGEAWEKKRVGPGE